MKKIYYILSLMIFFSCGKDSLSDTQTKLVDVTPTISETSESDTTDSATTDGNSSSSDDETTSEDSSSSDNFESQTFDRKALLTNWANNIIIPLYENFNTNLTALSDEITKFNETPNLDNLKLVREKWLDAYKSWQHVEMFNLGKAEETYFQSKMNVYPSDKERIERNLTNETYNLDNPNNNDAQGFPALDYMLYGSDESDEKIVDKYLLENKKYNTYLSSLIDKMVSNTSVVVNDWNQNKDTYINSTENTSTSSINKITNDFIYYYEKLFRANKIGIPAGVFSGSKLPDRVEGYYSKIYSKDLALEAMSAIENFFVGKKYNSEEKGESLESYLNFLNSEKNGTSLSESITDQFKVAKETIDKLNNDFASQVNEDNNKMLVAYDEIQKGVVFMKTDMLQSLSISVDYVDADGD
ncbi:MAG: imelysin family protein [Bacteroidota bacterium]|nr:imelysin family protein [Bacteroidota bacterium]